MNELLEFLEFAAKTEFTTPGGVINFSIVGVMGLLAAALATSELLKFLAWLLDRVIHFVEKCLELCALLMRVPFKADPMPDPYEPDSALRTGRLLIVIGVFFIACMLALGGSEYQQDDPRQRPTKTSAAGSRTASRFVDTLPGIANMPAPSSISPFGISRAAAQGAVSLL